MADEGYEMKKIQKLSFLLIILSFSNFCSSNDKKIMLLNEEIDQLSQRFIVDKSLSFNSTLITKNGQDLEIRGKTTSKDLYNELMIVSDSLNLKLLASGNCTSNKCILLYFTINFPLCHTVQVL